MNRRSKRKMKKICLVIFILILIIVSLLFVYKMVIKNPSDSPKEPAIDNVVDDSKDNTSPLVTSLKKEEYFIEKNLDRYLNYIQKYPDKSMTEVVSSVNANIDYDYYTHSIDTDINVGYLMLVNKFYKLSSDYVPDLVQMDDQYNHNKGYKMMNRTAYEHFKEMAAAAREDGITLFNVSAYRSYATQEILYNNYASRDGKEAADTYSARAGYSEHQTGLASDINTSSSSAHFENTKEYAWLQKNAYKYGFILRFPKDKEKITGYKYEPWHYRYVGVEAATYIYEHDITLEEYYAYFVENK